MICQYTVNILTGSVFPHCGSHNEKLGSHFRSCGFYFQWGIFNSSFQLHGDLWRVICMLFAMWKPCFDRSLFYNGKFDINYSWKCQCISKLLLWTSSSTMIMWFKYQFTLISVNMSKPETLGEHFYPNVKCYSNLLTDLLMLKFLPKYVASLQCLSVIELLVSHLRYDKKTFKSKNLIKETQLNK